MPKVSFNQSSENTCLISICKQVSMETTYIYTQGRELFMNLSPYSLHKDKLCAQAQATNSLYKKIQFYIFFGRIK